LLVTAAVHDLGWAALLAGDFVRSRRALEESLALARGLGETLHTAEALRTLGELDLLTGDVDSAESRIRESLGLYEELDAELDRAACLTALGGVAASRGLYEEAARLFAAAEELRRDRAVEAPERAVLERFQSAVEAALGAKSMSGPEAEP
jgi:tetratricopeptide (TPR) repeat protein